MRSSGRVSNLVRMIRSTKKMSLHKSKRRVVSVSQNEGGLFLTGRRGQSGSKKGRAQKKLARNLEEEKKGIPYPLTVGKRRGFHCSGTILPASVDRGVQERKKKRIY